MPPVIGGYERSAEIMKHPLSIAIFLLCVITPIRAHDVPDLIVETGYAEGLRFDFPLDSKILLRTPVWEEGQENPPLAPRKAESLAKTKLKRLLKAPEKWSRAEIVLIDSGDNSHWYYVVEFENRSGNGTLPPNMRIVVLMDGSIPEPRQTPYEAKKVEQGADGKSPEATQPPR